jgi:hypothetical protein
MAHLTTNQEFLVTRSTLWRISLAALALTLAATAGAHAQQPADDDPAVLQLAQPDFTLVALPTNLRLPLFKSAFRVTHRFIRPLGDGGLGELTSDLFGLDSGGQIGLEYRFGIIRNGQIGLHRTSNRTIELFAQYDLLRQPGSPFGISGFFSIDGTNNMKDSYSPALGAVISRTIGDYAALYVEPMWVNNTNQLPAVVADHNDTFLVGLGTRIRVSPTVYLVGEVTPRPAGYRPGVTQGSVGLEKRAGGHLFQVNFSNAFGTTFGQIARGGPEENDWFLGFNISRKFF